MATKKLGSKAKKSSVIPKVTTGIAVLDYAVDAARCLNVCCMDTDKYYSSTQDATIMSFSRQSSGNYSPQLVELLTAVESGKVHRQPVRFKQTLSSMVTNYARIAKMVVSPYAVVVHTTLHLTRGSIPNTNMKIPSYCNRDSGGRFMQDYNLRTSYTFLPQDVGLVGTDLQGINKKALFGLIASQIKGHLNLTLLPPTTGTFTVEFNNYTGADFYCLSEKQIKSSPSKYCKKAIFDLVGTKANPSGIRFGGSVPSGVTLVTLQTPSNKLDWYFSDCLLGLFSSFILSFVTKVK